MKCGGFIFRIMIEIKSLSGELLASYDVESLREAVEKAVDDGKKLSGANLYGANLSGAEMAHAETDKRYIQIGCIGRFKRITTYCVDDNIVWCGCFTGTLEEFEERVKVTHADNKQYLGEYLGAINYFKQLKDMKL